MSAAFLIFVVTIIVLLGMSIFRFLPPNYKIPALAGLAVWITYSSLLGYSGVISNTTTLPPGIIYFLVPTILFVIFMARSSIGQTVASNTPLWLLVGMQSFRFVVEVFIHQLYVDGELPVMLTFYGANFDILIGISAPILAWLIASQKISNRMVILWNIIGIGMLMNIVVRAILTSPGPLHLIATEVPNLAIRTFPFSYIPGLLLPLALALHVLSIRALRHQAVCKK